MNKDIIKGNWHQIQGKLKQQWAKLSDDQIAQMQGSYEELSGQLQKTYGYKKEQAQKEIESFLYKNKLNG